MNVSIQNFTQLNDYLEKAEGKLRTKPEKEAVTREKIQQIMRENLGVVNGSDFNEVGRFLQSVKQIAVLGEGEGLVTMAIDAVVNASGSLSLESIGKFKELDETLYYESLAHHISSKKLPIKSLGLSEEEMIKVMPWVTHLDLTDADADDYSLKNCTFTDQFLEKILENASSLETLIIKNSNINGSCFAGKESLKVLQSLQKLEISKCSDFNQNLNGLSGLKELKIENSREFNQSLNGLQGLVKLEITRCTSFNHSIDGLPNLENLEIANCYEFNSSLSQLQGLKELKILRCPIFNQTLDELPNLEKLQFSSCSDFNQSLNNLKNLDTLQMDFCLAFNQSVNGLQRLHSLKIHSSPVFSQSINGLSSLERLDIYKCDAFNHSLNELPSLKELDIDQCPAFNQSLNELTSLESLLISKSEAFNQSLDELKSLKYLRLSICGAFNQSINGLPKLVSLTLASCGDFNQSLIGLPELEKLVMMNCNSFNRTLSELPNLKLLHIGGSPNFKIQDLQTAYILNRCNPKLLEDFLSNTPPELHAHLVEDLLQIVEEKTKTVENVTPEIKDYLSLLLNFKMPDEKLKESFNRIPLLPLLLKLFEMDNLVNQGVDAEEVKEGFAGLREMDNYLDFLRITVQLFPQLTSFLIRNLKDEIIPDLKSLNVIDQLPWESKMSLLPLFSPNQVREFITAVPEEMRVNWLENEIQFEQFSGNVKDVLTEIVENNIQGADQQALDNLLIPLKELIAKIPFNILAVLSSVKPETMLAYTFVMDDAQMASVIPPIPEEVLMQHLMKQSIQTHREYLLYATTGQKEAYIVKDLFGEPESLTGWDQGMAQIEELMSQFEKEKTKEHFQELEGVWREIVNKTNLTAQTYQQAGQAVKSMLLKFSSSKEYENTVISYLEPKMKRAEEILQGLKVTGKKIEALESQVVGQVEIPDEFVDSITGDLMESPHHHPSTPDYIYDLSTWQMMSTHPATRAPVNQEELVPDAELKAKIEAFRKENPGLE